MFEVMLKNIPVYSTKVCVPLSGGLDSRVLAGLITCKQKVDLSFCQYRLDYPIIINRGIANVSYARQIAGVLNIPFYSININEDNREDREAIKGLGDTVKKSRMYTGIRKMNDIVNLKDYTIVVGHGLDTVTGVHVTPLTLFNYEKFEVRDRIKMHDYFNNIFPGTYGRFAKWDCPLWNREVVEFCLSMPLKYRHLQRAYRFMIKKYFPELAKIPREDMHVRMDIGEIRYFYERTKYWLKK